ncbi:hypothetical protein ACIA5C_47160 [Actinoplanes sp. NPDC051343]|uniref:hypothetical protein n=1 Tax=Actinoplanes sp. NPDC051343 TaxID=3363906 RepID=UPI0037AA653C
MIRLVSAIRKGIFAAVVLTGAALLLLAVCGNPLPARLPDAGQFRAWIDAPFQPRYATATARTFAWLLWSVIAVTVIATGVARLRRLRLTQVVAALPGPVQGVTAALLGAAAVTSATPGLATAAPPVDAAVPAGLPTAGSESNNALLHRTAEALTPANTETVQAVVAVAPRETSSRLSIARPTDVPLTAAAAVPSGSPTSILATARAGIGAATIGSPSHGAGTPAGPRGAPAGTCRVNPGDTLWDLAEKHLGDPHRWREIYLLNRGHRQANGYALTDPDEIDVNWVLALPSRHPGHRPAGPPTAHQPPPPTSHPAIPPTAPIAPPTSSITAPTTPTKVPSRTATSANHQASNTATTPPSSSSIGSLATSRSAPAAAGDDQAAGPLDGIDVPGGWITLGLGGALLAAVAMVWRRRRHRYQPTPITRPRLDDLDLLPPLAAMTRIRTSLRRTAPETLDEHPVTAPTVREYRNATVPPELPPIGPSGCELAGAADLPLSAGLGLTGDGALDAARGLLVATLAAGNDNDPDAKGRAIIAGATLATLLGVSAADLGHLDRLTVTASQADAITALEEEIIRRSRRIADAQVADVHTLRDNDFHAEPMPQLLLIAEQPEPAWTNRMVTAVQLGHSVNIGIVIIGDWPTGTTLTIAADGTTGNNDTPRLSVLDTAAAIAMLGLLRDAHRNPEHPAPAEPVDRPEPPDIAAATDYDPEPGPQTRSKPTSPAAETAASTAPVGGLPIRLRVLGSPAVLDHDGQPSPGIRNKAIELLVYLAVNRKGADLSDVMEALYPDANMRRASERLSTVVADLRKHIRRAAAHPDDTDTTLRQRLEPVPNTGSRYHLDPAIVRVDWWTALDQSDAAAVATDDQQRLTHLLTAIDAANGGLAEGAEYDWIDTDREVVRRHRIKLHAHAAALLADTDPHRSWLLLEQGCQIDPLSDELARTTMRAAAALADADAIRHRLKTLREALDAHGLEISDDTETLARDLLRQLQPPNRPSEAAT